MATLSTPLCDRLGIDHPIVQAPIGSVTCPELAAAVSNVGGLGTLAVTWRDLDRTRAVVRETAALTDEPFGVNLVLDEATRQRPTQDHLDVVLDEGIDVVSFSFGDAGPYVERVQAAGAVVMQTVGSVAEAETALDAGVDVLVAQGWESGGHVQSQVATMPLVPRVVDLTAAVDREVPVVAAGGIADGRGLAATLALGGDGVWLGTRFVATQEAAAHERYKSALLGADADDTFFSELFDGGWPGQAHRVLRNRTVQTWLDAGRPASGSRPGEGETVATYPSGETVERYDDDPPLPSASGDVDEMALYAGQSAGLTDDERSAGAVVESLVDTATERVAELSELTGS
jgi:nitronate monooxygenase